MKRGNDRNKQERRANKNRKGKNKRKGRKEGRKESTKQRERERKYKKKVIKRGLYNKGNRRSHRTTSLMKSMTEGSEINEAPPPPPPPPTPFPRAGGNINTTGVDAKGGWFYCTLI